MPSRGDDQDRELVEGFWVWLVMAGAFLFGCSQDMSGYIHGLKSYSCQRADRIQDCRQIPPQQIASRN